MSSGSFLNLIFPVAQLLIRIWRCPAQRSGSQVIVLLWKGVRMGPHTFQGKKIGEKAWKDQGRKNGVDTSASKVAWESPWLHTTVLQSWEKHSMEDAKMTRVFVQG